MNSFTEGIHNQINETHKSIHMDFESKKGGQEIC